MVVTKYFTCLFQHHCRQCGSVVCGSCSAKKRLIPHISTKPVRVCDECISKSDEEVKPTVDSSVQQIKIGKF